MAIKAENETGYKTRVAKPATDVKDEDEVKTEAPKEDAPNVDASKVEGLRTSEPEVPAADVPEPLSPTEEEYKRTLRLIK
jgi:hypothetical protein